MRGAASGPVPSARKTSPTTTGSAPAARCARPARPRQTDCTDERSPRPDSDRRGRRDHGLVLGASTADSHGGCPADRCLRVEAGSSRLLPWISCWQAVGHAFAIGCGPRRQATVVPWNGEPSVITRRALAAPSCCSNPQPFHHEPAGRVARSRPPTAHLSKALETRSRPAPWPPDRSGPRSPASGELNDLPLGAPAARIRAANASSESAPATVPRHEQHGPEPVLRREIRSACCGYS